jgi:hypothetical protein
VLSSLKQRGAVLLAVGLAGLSIVADLLQLFSAGGRWIWLTVLSGAAVVLLLVLFVGPLLRRNIRGAWLFSAVRRTGLVDVEHRADKRYRLPPDELFRVAGSQPVLITGILDQLFQRQRSDLLAFLASGGELRVLLLHPVMVASSLRKGWTRHNDGWVRYWLTNCHEAQVALDGILEAGMDRMPGFQVRFMADIPPYLGTLVGRPAVRFDPGAPCFVRVQPVAMSNFVGRGSVMTFERLRGETDTPFAYYAADLLAQWEVGVEDEDLLQRRRLALES